MPEIVEDHRPVSLARRIKLEAEHRISRGISVNGSPFRCDDQSVLRVAELASVFSDGLAGPGGITFRTSAGQTLTLRTLAEVNAIHDAQRRHRADGNGFDLPG